MKVSARYAVFAEHHSANAWLALGWMPSPAFERCYHGQFSVLCVWICGCEARRPHEPNATTIKAMEAADRGDLVTVGDVDGLLADLQIECQRDHDDNREGGRYGEGFW